MPKIICCKMCFTKVAEIEHGSKLKKDIVMLCPLCYEKCRTAVMMANMATGSTPDFLKDLFR